jgi:hypothetical protein
LYRSNDAFAASSLFTSKSIIAENLVKFASTGTFICLKVADTVLLGRSICKGAACSIEIKNSCETNVKHSLIKLKKFIPTSKINNHINQTLSLTTLTLN